MKTQIDIITANGGSIRGTGSVAQRLLQANFDAGVLRPWIDLQRSRPEGFTGNAVMVDGQQFFGTGRNFQTLSNGEVQAIANATLRKDEWKQYDQAILKIARDRLSGVQDLVARGLTYNIPNGLGTTVLEYEDMSDMEAADISMDAVTRGKHDRPEFDLNYLPLPIIHKDFHVNIRTLNASRRTGAPLDTTMAELATRKVLEKLETILFQGASSFAFGGGTIYGYQDFTHRNTYTISTAWTASGGDPVTDVIGMKQALINDKFFGPYVLYVPTNYETALDENYSSNYAETVRERLLKIDGISDVKVSDYLSSSNVILVQMTSDVVRMVQGMGVTPIEWTTEGGMVTQYKIMTIQVPQLRADQDNRCGICHAS